MFAECAFVTPLKVGVGCTSRSYYTTIAFRHIRRRNRIRVESAAAAAAAFYDVSSRENVLGASNLLRLIRRALSATRDRPGPDTTAAAAATVLPASLVHVKSPPPPCPSYTSYSVGRVTRATGRRSKVRRVGAAGPAEREIYVRSKNVSGPKGTVYVYIYIYIYVFIIKRPGKKAIKLYVVTSRARVSLLFRAQTDRRKQKRNYTRVRFQRRDDATTLFRSATTIYRP